MNIRKLCEDTYKKLGELYIDLDTRKSCFKSNIRLLNGKKLDQIVLNIKNNPIQGDSWMLPEQTIRTFKSLLSEIRKRRQKESRLEDLADRANGM